MVPAAFVTLGGVAADAERQARPQGAAGARRRRLARRGYEAPVGAIERRWPRSGRSCSALERVGRHDNFFELGGHSLLAVTRDRADAAAGPAADVRTLFATPTLAGLAAAVGGDDGVAVPPNLIPAGCTSITPEMLPLVELDAGRDRPDRRHGAGRGGQRAGHLPAGAVAGRHPVPPPDGAGEGDPYLLSSLLAFDSRTGSTASWRRCRR